MKFNRPRTGIKGKLLTGMKALAINCFIIFSLPVWYLFHSGDIFSLNQERQKPINAVKVNLKDPPKKVEKIKPRVKDRDIDLERRNNTIANRFRLDMGVHTGAGTGVALGKGTSQNIIFSQNEVEVNPIRIGGRNPVVPSSFSDLNQNGKVEVEVVIDENGYVISAHSISEDPKSYGLKESVLTALKTWKFKPAQVNRIPVKVRVIIPFLF